MMSGAEIIGVISGILAILDAAAQVFSAASDASGLPEAFRDVAGRLPLVQETLRTVKQRLDSGGPDEILYKALQPTAAACKDKATRLQALIEKSVPEENTSKMERYLLALRTLGKKNRIESLMKGILIDVQLLADNHVMRLPTKVETERLMQGSIQITAIPHHLSQDTTRGPRIFHYGTGSQIVNTRDSPQNNNNGSGKQFIGGTFHGFNATLV